MSSCNFIITRGTRKGQLCGVKSKNGGDKCSKHSKSETKKQCPYIFKKGPKKGQQCTRFICGVACSRHKKAIEKVKDVVVEELIEETQVVVEEPIEETQVVVEEPIEEEIDNDIIEDSDCEEENDTQYEKSQPEDTIDMFFNDSLDINQNSVVNHLRGF